MPSLSERAEYWSQCGDAAREQFVKQMCQAIESLTEARVAASNQIESMQHRIEELENQVKALSPPKEVGPIVVPAWKKLSESDLPAESS
jgi:polyhydroxyalkanoate synthesis regulator phasin